MAQTNKSKSLFLNLKLLSYLSIRSVNKVDDDDDDVVDLFKTALNHQTKSTNKQSIFGTHQTKAINKLNN